MGRPAAPGASSSSVRGASPGSSSTRLAPADQLQGVSRLPAGAPEWAPPTWEAAPPGWEGSPDAQHQRCCRESGAPVAGACAQPPWEELQAADACRDQQGPFPGAGDPPAQKASGTLVPGACPQIRTRGPHLRAGKRASLERGSRAKGDPGPLLAEAAWRERGDRKQGLHSAGQLPVNPQGCGAQHW